ncbi:MAG: hypothetical protein KC645_12180 [Gemmatimonadetes bacterium]|nr:hypothetical protein [Gemmatimonadota bacterium]
MISTQETVHGLLRLADGHVTIEWRRARKTDHIGGTIRTDREVEAVRAVRVPLERVAGAHVPPGRLRWWVRPRLVLVAADLGAFEAFAGEGGLALDHPGELILPVRRRDRLRAEEFAAELALALAEHSARRTLPRSGAERVLEAGEPNEFRGPEDPQ